MIIKETKIVTELTLLLYHEGIFHYYYPKSRRIRMKKFSIILLLICVVLTSTFAGSLPGDVISINAIGSYRKMTTESVYQSQTAKSTSIFTGAGVGFNYDSYFNNYVGVYGNLFVAVPVKYTIDGTTVTDFNNKDLPVGLQVGCVGRFPTSNTFGLNLRLGIASVYDKSSIYYYRVYSPYYGYIIEYSETISKVEYQLNASANVYYNFDSDGNFGLAFGVNASYTFLTSLIRKTPSGNTQDIVADLNRSGYEIMPFVGITIGSGY